MQVIFSVSVFWYYNHITWVSFFHNLFPLYRTITKKERYCCKHDLILQQHHDELLMHIAAEFASAAVPDGQRGAMQSRREISTHIAERVFRIYAAHPNSACMPAQKLRLQKIRFSQLFKFRIS